MRHIWNTIGFVIVTIVVVHLMLDMVKPYVPLVILSAVVIYGGGYFVRNMRNW